MNKKGLSKIGLILVLILLTLLLSWGIWTIVNNVLSPNFNIEKKQCEKEIVSINITESECIYICNISNESKSESFFWGDYPCMFECRDEHLIYEDVCTTENVTEIEMEKDGVREVRSIDRKSPYNQVDKTWLDNNCYTSKICNKEKCISEEEGYSEKDLMNMVMDIKDYHPVEYKCGDYQVEVLK
jgi:regulatory protein YycH of two-component signal transduction system YycFG